MSLELQVLRLTHILGGVAWVGAANYMTFFLIPAFVEAGPAGGAIMAGLQRRKFPAWMTFYAVITILSGFRLMQVTSNGFSDEYFATMMGMVLLVASVMTVIAFSIGFFVSRPAMTTAAALMMQREAAAPDRRLAIDVQIAGLRARGNAASMAVTLILLVATAGMAVARYL